MNFHGMGRRTAIGKSYLSLAAALALFAGCSMEGPGANTADGPTVYLGGSTYNQSNGGQACYWEGSTRIDLPDSDTHPSLVKGIDVFEGAVYSTGNYSDGSSRRACYWEGSTRHDLPGDGLYSAYARAIDVANGVVYTAGHYYDSDSKSTPCYWVGAARYDLPLADDSTGGAYGIAVVGDTVYICGGYANNTTGTGACYWTDTLQQGAVRTELLSGTIGVSIPSADGICVSDGSVYVVGSHYDESGEAPYRSHPCYWKDGALYNLAEGPTLDSKAVSIAVSGGTVHAAGYYASGGGGRSACYWKDMSRYDLPDGESSYSEATSIAISDGAVYAGGWYEGHIALAACYWKGIDRIDLPVEAGDEDYVGAIAVEEE